MDTNGVDILSPDTIDNFALARERMAQELTRNGVTSVRVLNAMKKVPRHLFVSEALRYSAYNDVSLPIGFSQTISRPTTVGRMIQSLGLTGRERVLEVGTGSGYQAAVTAELADRVVSMERIEALHRRAKMTLLMTMNYRNIELYHTGDFSDVKGTFDAILVAACAPVMPEHLISLLNNGGRMLIPVEKGNSQVIKKFVRHDEEIVYEEEVGEAQFVPLVM